MPWSEEKKGRLAFTFLCSRRGPFPSFVGRKYKVVYSVKGLPTSLDTVFSQEFLFRMESNIHSFNVIDRITTFADLKTCWMLLWQHRNRQTKTRKTQKVNKKNIHFSSLVLSRAPSSCKTSHRFFAFLFCWKQNKIWVRNCSTPR